MKSICNQIKATVAVAAVSSVATFVNIPSANAALFGLNWTGAQGYSAKGQFSFSDNFSGSVVTQNQLETFTLSFFNPTGNLLKTFAYDFSSPTTSPSSSFNFNFDTVTKTILQSGSYNTSTGFDLGNEATFSGNGLLFYTFQDSSQGLATATIFLKPDDLNPETCVISGGCNYDFGGQLTANRIPEPGTIFGLLVLGSVAGFLKKKSASASAIKLT
ncbi:PEP-CTERM sorting domain-containing protein [Anabaena sphaerica FACHB-251]|uniref:PEP-CTERM sorting domain-containing protein n=1 Tax=Anabaena sphaerica FACHB-251 TaxID=2692883 RepID=A0A926WKS9_9NOST|nr:PEP-CTERM sorting domain-containing protein [Anabaena sphaerica]MBD2295825.1 PEP-CTERM sorting domain-containing protein [Anabaena sphaerica FACHB-251]